ncbi:hypothetical protein Q3G72_030808 [Acer saccharum]|nr:hypothetical protein Q3G72_030808 [Acer saccharum]
MPEDDKVSWNTVIGSLSVSESSIYEAVKYYLYMMRVGVNPNRVIFINILAAVSSLSLGKCGEMDECEKIFSRMSDRKDDLSWNSMISGYRHNNLWYKAMVLGLFMIQRGQRLDHFTFVTVLCACASVATLERGMELHASALRARLESNVLVGGALVAMYSQWYACNGHEHEALRLFSRMVQSGQRLDHFTLSTVLSACASVVTLERGYACHGHGNKALELFSRMVQSDQRLDHFTLSIVLSACASVATLEYGACCRANGCKIELGRKAADMLFEMEPQNDANYMLLANMYAYGDKWEDAARVRKLMREAEVKKEAGSCWVTTKDGVHVFVAGGKSHP